MYTNVQTETTHSVASTFFISASGSVIGPQQQFPCEWEALMRGKRGTASDGRERAAYWERYSGGAHSRVSVFKSPIRVKPLIRVSGPWGGPAPVVRATDISPGRRCTAGSGPPGPRPDNPPRTGGNMASGALAASVSAAAARVTARAAPAGKLLGRVGDLLLQRRLTPWMLLTASDMHTSNTESVVARASSLTRIAAAASGSKVRPAATHSDPPTPSQTRLGNGPMSSGDASHVPSHVCSRLGNGAMSAQQRDENGGDSQRR